MRYPEGHKEETRHKILERASQILRKDGLDALSITGLMRDVGLTHGGFYAHFGSRDELVAEAIRFGGEETQHGMFARAPHLNAVLEQYLGVGHASSPEQGCIVAATGTQSAGRSESVLEAFDHTARGLIGLVESKLGDREEPSDQALATTALMVGGVVLARLVEDPELAQRILDAARQRAHPTT